MIDVNGVKITLGKKLIVNDVTINVNPGEFVGLIGPNGSGKSTLLKAIYRVLSSYDGTIFIDGNNIQESTMKESAKVTSVVPQQSYSNFDFKVLDVALMGRSPHKKAMEFDNEEDYRIARESLECVGMSDYSDSSYSILSGGEQQRTILARALTQQTKCIILDEPTNHLDVKYQLQLMDIIRNMNATKLCAIHDLNIAAQYCDRIYILKNGKVYANGTPEEVLTEKMIKEVYEVDSAISRSPCTGNMIIEYISNKNTANDSSSSP